MEKQDNWFNPETGELNENDPVKMKNRQSGKLRKGGKAGLNKVIGRKNHDESRKNYDEMQKRESSTKKIEKASDRRMAQMFRDTGDKLFGCVIKKEFEILETYDEDEAPRFEIIPEFLQAFAYPSLNFLPSLTCVKETYMYVSIKLKYD
jgi:hypothetical protein